MGPISLDECGKPVLNLETVPNVGQFWTYDPKAFLAMPPYSRESPVAKNLE